MIGWIRSASLLAAATLLCGCPDATPGIGAGTGGTDAGIGAGTGSTGSTSSTSSSGGTGGTSSTSSSSGTGGGCNEVAIASDGGFPCVNPYVPAADGTISNFDTVIAPYGGGYYAYPSVDMGGPDVTYGKGQLDVTASAIPTWGGFGMSFSKCVDASAFRGVEFTFWGTAPKDSLVFTLTLNSDLVADPNSRGGGCVPADPNNTYPSCHSPSVGVPIPETGVAVMVPFATLSGGVPSMCVNPKEITGISWGFADDGSPPYSAEVHMTGLKFVR